MTRQWNKTTKKKLYLLVALGLALILSSGAFAYTYVTSVATIGVTPPTAELATCNATASQPNWSSVLVPAETTNTEILNPNAVGDETEIQSQIASASHWQLVWLKFSRHKLAIVAGMVLIALYTAAIFAPFLSPHDPHAKSLPYKEAPPQRVYLTDEQGFHLRPFVYAITRTLDRQTYQQIFKEDRSRKYYLRFFARGFRYRLLGLFETDIHLFGTEVEEVHVHLFGADVLGRDVFSRVLYGAQV